MDLSDPPEREFQGGDEVMVVITPISGKPDCVDMTFEDGQFALEVPRDFLEILSVAE